MVALIRSHGEPGRGNGAALRFSCAREGKLWYNFREWGDMAENKFREIFDVLKTDIIAGKYVGNASLPSAPVLMRRFGVARATAVAALKKKGSGDMAVEQQKVSELISIVKSI